MFIIKYNKYSAVSQALKITPDEWRVMTPGLFSEKFDTFYKSEHGTEYVRKAKLINEIRAIPEAEAKKNALCDKDRKGRNNKI